MNPHAAALPRPCLLVSSHSRLGPSCHKASVHISRHLAELSRLQRSNGAPVRPSGAYSAVRLTPQCAAAATSQPAGCGRRPRWGLSVGAGVAASSGVSARPGAGSPHPTQGSSIPISAALGVSSLPLVGAGGCQGLPLGARVLQQRRQWAVMTVCWAPAPQPSPRRCARLFSCITRLWCTQHGQTFESGSLLRATAAALPSPTARRSPGARCSHGQHTQPRSRGRG